LKFSEIDEKYVTTQINKVNIKKATGKDGISPKNFKIADKGLLEHKQNS
jgi:hypothetical protein